MINLQKDVYENVAAMKVTKAMEAKEMTYLREDFFIHEVS
jgi:hypothetical protein